MRGILRIAALAACILLTGARAPATIELQIVRYQPLIIGKIMGVEMAVLLTSLPNRAILFPQFAVFP